MDWHSLYPEEIYLNLRTQREGLSREEAGRRLKEYGPNEFLSVRRKKVTRILFDQFKGVFILILIAAGFVSFLLGDTTDALIIAVVVLINAFFGFIQEYKAERTFQLLQKSLEEYAVVIRGNEEWEIIRKEVVPGDIVVVERGRKISADCRLLSARNLLVNEAILTGEWLPEKKEPGLVDIATSLGDRTNMLYMGTVVEEGSGIGVAVATGKDTEFGGVAESILASADLKTPLEKSLRRFSLYLGLAISGIVAGLFVIGIFRGVSFLQMFLSSVALAVAAVPEGLAISLTIILAIGMRRILQQKGLVRHLFAAETLGSVSVIATDKTGTITEARMQVSHILTGTKELLRDGDRISGLSGDGSESHLLALRLVAAASEAVIENPESELEEWRIRGRPTDRALIEAALEAGIRKDEMLKRGEILDSLPFDENRKYSAAVLRGREGKNVLAVVGAPEVILKASSELHVDGHTASLRSTTSQKLNERYFELVRLGLRVIAVAHKEIKSVRIDQKGFEVLSGLTLVGFIAMRDPVRKEVKDAVEISKEAGVKTVIVTGDHSLTARAVAKDIGLDISEAETLEGKEISAMDEKTLRERVKSVFLFARVSPGDKVRIVDAYQANGETIAMVGDGVNDAPALKRADIGIALGSATDISKDAADLVLLDDSFSVIVSAIREGRIIIENLRKTVVFLLTDGFTEIIIVGLSFLFSLPLPILPAQILWVNLIEDTLPALSLAFEKGESADLSRRPERKIKLLPRPLALFTGFFAVVSSFTAFGIFWWLYATNGSLDYARTMAMALIGADSLFYIFSVKNLHTNIIRGRFFDNLVLIVSVVSGFFLLFAAVYVPFLQELLKTVSLSLRDWVIIIGFGIFNVVLTEVLKFFFLSAKNRERRLS
ncbi:MAG: HAD-IC family P-type ATPase [Candidatus Sungbacteria bacterium]|nr:HAD-IC family P-type ATPase [Candidatus Sungbacteria bacterium]